jgi:deoxyribodipyrimidine photo-lyase
MIYDRSLCWLRRDLRLDDNTALSVATHKSKKVFLVFVFDICILKKLQDKDDRRITFIVHSLRELSSRLRSKKSDLLVRIGNPIDEIPKLAAELKVNAVFANRDYEPYAKTRDLKVSKRLLANGIDFKSYKDQVIFEYPEIISGQGRPYRVYTPYKNNWLKKIGPQDINDQIVNFKTLSAIRDIDKYTMQWDFSVLGFKEKLLWLKAGETAAQKRFDTFEKVESKYFDNRNFPYIEDGTSGLSVHLRFGTISIRKLVRGTQNKNNIGTKTWLSELIWRDFYQTILDQFPHVASSCFKVECDQIVWPGENRHFYLWCQGMTGYPLIDAAMRHFNKTGWMHNRLRMIVASFLTKDLLVDWRKGEKWFARKLLDFDLAANNGGWQWSASTGCDAQPYFRIFNPITQSKKFDPDGRFIRQHTPELSGFSDRRIHWPHDLGIEEQSKAKCLLGSQYPHPIVAHAIQRKRAIELFKEVKS